MSAFRERIPQLHIRDKLPGRVTESKLSRPALLVSVFLFFTVVMMWPLPLHASSTVQDLGDPLFEIWEMRWVQHQLVTDPGHLWDSNMGYPFTHSLLFSEPYLSTAVIEWPIQLLTGNDVLTYNLMLMGSYFLVGLGMALLIWELTDELGAATLAGFVAAFVPYRYGHLSHLNLLSYGWGILALWLLTRFARRRNILDAALATLFLTIQVLASETVGLMTGLVVGCAVLLLLWQERKRIGVRLVAGFASIIMIPALAALPVALAQLRVNHMYGFTRSLETISQMSATVQTYWSISPGSPFWRAVQILPSAYPNPLFPGVIATLGAIGGLVLGLRHWRGWTIYATALAGIGFVFSLGPYAQAGGHRYDLPYYFLYQYVPGFNAMRDAARFGMVALIGVEILAGLGFAALWRYVRPRLRPHAALSVGSTLLVVLLILARVELKVNVGTVHVAKGQASTAVYDWLATQPKAPVIEFPINGLWTNVLLTIHQIYYSTWNWDPIVAAYTSFVPQRDVDMLVAIDGGSTKPSLVDASNVGMLQDLGIRYVVIDHWPGYDWQLAVNTASHLPQLTFVGGMGDATVFTVSPGNRVPVSYSITAPDHANAGQQVVADVVAHNQNQTESIGRLQLDPAVTVEWRGHSGNTVSKSSVPVHMDVTIPPGLTIQPVVITAPSSPGTYQLKISSSGIANGLSQSVTVMNQSQSATSKPEVTLQRVTLSPGPYRPGDILNLVAQWQVNLPINKELTVTTQLLDDRNQLFSQRDGPPFGTTLPTSKWKPGMVIDEPLSVRIPSDVFVSQFRVLIALYDANSPTYDRTRIQLPDGSDKTEYESGLMKISSGNP